MGVASENSLCRHMSMLQNDLEDKLAGEEVIGTESSDS